MGEGLFPVRGDLFLHESAGGFAAFLGSFAGAFVLDRAER